MIEYEAVILAGGAGARLKSVVNDLPKPMADICGRPFLSYVFDYLVAAHVSNLIISVGYRSEMIMDYFGDRYKGVTVTYAIETEPLGTGGAIRESLKYVSSRDAIVLNGDTFFPVDLDEMMQQFRKKGCFLSMAVKELRRFDRYGTIMISSGRVTGFAEKSYCEQGFINGGIYAVNRDIVDYFPDLQRFSFETDLLEPRFEQLCISTFQSDAYFIDIGIPEDYQRAQFELPLQAGVFK